MNSAKVLYPPVHAGPPADDNFSLPPPVLYVYRQVQVLYVYPA